MSRPCPTRRCEWVIILLRELLGVAPVPAGAADPGAGRATMPRLRAVLAAAHAAPVLPQAASAPVVWTGTLGQLHVRDSDSLPRAQDQDGSCPPPEIAHGRLPRHIHPCWIARSSNGLRLPPGCCLIWRGAQATVRSPGASGMPRPAPRGRARQPPLWGASVGCQRRASRPARLCRGQPSPRTPTVGARIRRGSARP
jgi:hypothetical protein